MTDKARKKFDLVIALIERRLRCTNLLTGIVIPKGKNASGLIVSDTINERGMLREMRECLQESHTLCVSKARMNLLSKGLRKALQAAPKVTESKRTFIFDFAPGNSYEVY